MLNMKSTSSVDNTPYTDEDLDRFQHHLTRENIINIWKKMREGGNSKDGIVTRDKFRMIFYEFFDENRDKNIKSEKKWVIKESLINDIFERFRRRDGARDDRNNKRYAEEKRWQNDGEIDLHDLVVSLAILSNLGYDDKLELVFDLTDIDEDGCLSPDDVCKMLLAIERNFAKECSFIDAGNASSLYYVATKKALRRFDYIFLYENQEEATNNNGGKARKDKLLGHFKDFLEKLSGKKNLYNNLLPKNYSLRKVLSNKVQEVVFEINKNEEQQFKKFRSKLHHMLWNPNQQGEQKSKGVNSKKEEILRMQYKEPGDVGVKKTGDYFVYEEEPRNVETPPQTTKQKETVVQEKSSLVEHRKRLRDMKEKHYPKLEEIMGSKYEKVLKRKDVHLPPIRSYGDRSDIALTHTNITDIGTTELESMIDKRVKRLNDQCKSIGPGYKEYLLKKLTKSLVGNNEIARSSSVNPVDKKGQGYKFLK